MRDACGAGWSRHPARKLAQFDGGARVPATITAIGDAVRWAEEIMRAIDERWETRSGDRMNLNPVDRKGTH